MADTETAPSKGVNIRILSSSDENPDTEESNLEDGSVDQFAKIRNYNQRLKDSFPIGTIKSEEKPCSASLVWSIFNQIQFDLAHLDVRDSENFHGFLWLLCRLSPGAQKTLAQQQDVTRGEVSRWTSGKVTPRDLEKREILLRTVLMSLFYDLREGSLPPLKGRKTCEIVKLRND